MVSGSNAGFSVPASQLHIQTSFLQPAARCGRAEIVLQQGVQIGFVIHVHFEAEIAAKENLCACSLGLRKMLCETALSKMGGKETRGRALQGIGAGAVARGHDGHGRPRAFDGQQFIDVARLEQRQVERQTQ